MWPRLEEMLREADHDFVHLEVREGETAADCVATLPGTGVNGILVAGGDGTVMEVVNGMMREGVDVPLAIVPTGTANFVARAFGLPTDFEEAMRLAILGANRRVDVGQCGDRYFLLGVGLGIAERFVTETEEAEKKRLGWMAYLRNLATEVRAPRMTYCIEQEGEKPIHLTGVALVVVNAAAFGAAKPVSSEVRPDDGKLDIVVLHRLGLRDAMRIGWKALFGEVTHDSEVTHWPLESFVISSEPKVPIQVDGDDVGQSTPLQFHVHPHRFSVIVGTTEV